MGGNRTPSSQSLIARKASAAAWVVITGKSEPNRRRSVTRYSMAVLEPVVELPPAVEARREVGEDVLVLPEQHHGLLHHRLSQMRDDHPQARERPGDPVQQEGCPTRAPLPDRRHRPCGT